MSQHDFNLANQSGPAFRADLNSLALAIATLNAGASAPSPTFANMLWYDTGSGFLMKRDNANTTWQAVFAIDALGNITFRPGANDRNAIQVRNAANQTVAVLRVDSSGHGRVIAEDSDSDLRVLLRGDTAGGKIYLDGDETTGKQVSPTLIFGPALLDGTTGVTTTNIPAGATQIDMVLRNVAMSGTNSLMTQIGTSAGLTIAGYASTSIGITSSASVTTPLEVSEGFGVRMGVAGAVLNGHQRLWRVADSNVWLESHQARYQSGQIVVQGSGVVTLADTLDRVRAARTLADTFSSGNYTLYVRF